jgi:hypothetical protein
MMAYAFATTIPSYIGIQDQVGPFLGWVLGLISAYLNAAVAWAAINVPSIAALRRAARERDAAGVPAPSLVPIAQAA